MSKIIGDVYGYFMQIQMDAVSAGEVARQNLEQNEQLGIKNMSIAQQESQARTADLMFELSKQGVDLILPMLGILEAWRNGVSDETVAKNLEAFLQKVEV